MGLVTLIVLALKRNLLYNFFMNPEKFSRLSDTSQQDEEVQVALLKKLTNSQRADKAFSLSHELINLSKRAIRRRNPGLGELEIKLLYLYHFYGLDIAQKVRAYLLEKNILFSLDFHL